METFTQVFHKKINHPQISHKNLQTNNSLISQIIYDQGQDSNMKYNH